MGIVQNTYIAWIAQEDSERQQQVLTYRDYYEGTQPVSITDRIAAFLNISKTKTRGVNLCATIVDTPCERLEVTGFTVSAKDKGVVTEPTEAGETQATEDNAKALAALLDGWWAANRMDAVQGWVHLAAFRDAEAFVMVEYDTDEGRPYLCHDYAYDGTSGVKVHIKPGTYNAVMCASKRWQERVTATGTTRRMNIYFPDRIEKWVSTSTAQGAYSEFQWRPLDIEGANDPTLHAVELKDEDGVPYLATVSWWTENRKQGGKPLGVPVIPFINKDDGTGRGLSEIDPAIPIQDAYNKNHIDKMAAADMTGFGMFWTNGIPPAGGYQVYPGAMLPVAPRKDGESAQIGTLPASDITPLITNGQDLIAVLSGITATPQSRFTPSAVKPAEGTQQQEEGALVAKVEDRQRVWGNSWEDVMKMALKVAKAFGPANRIPDTDGIVISTSWAEAQTRSEAEHVNAVAVKVEKLEVPVEQAWSEVGYDAAQIRKFNALRNKQQAAARLAEARARAQQASQTPPQQPSNSGNGGEPPSGPQSPPAMGGNGQRKTEPMMSISWA